MDFSADYIVAAVAIGVGATLIMDVWNAFLGRAFGLASLNYCLLGRWLLHIPSGTIRHSNIKTAPPRANECSVGWLAHYTIGVVFSLIFVAIASGEWLAQPRILPALLFGIVTVVFPFFVLQPSLGLGLASSRTPSPARARLKSLVTHCVFGVGLYLAAIALQIILRQS